MDLFTPIVPPNKIHPNLARILARGDHYNRAVVNRWAEGFVDRDGKFVHEFQTTFNSSFWELYLFAVLKELNFTIDFNHHVPDFVVTSPDSFCVEATIASHAKGAPEEWSGKGIGSIPPDLNEFNRSAILRLLNAISSKSKKYIDKYQKLDHVKGKPFVLAIAPFDQPLGYLQVNRAIEAALYGYYVDEEAYLASDDRTTPPLSEKMLGVKKGPDLSIPVGVFNDSSHAHISAVVFNSCATWGKVRALSDDPDLRIQFAAVRKDPGDGTLYQIEASKGEYEETLLDGLRVYQNPFATYPLDWGAFDAPAVYQTIPADREADEWFRTTDRPSLIFRLVKLPKVPLEGG